MMFNWVRRLFRIKFDTEEEVRKIMVDSDTSLPEVTGEVKPRDTEEDDRTLEDLRRHIHAAHSTLFRFQMQRTLRRRAGYHRNGA